jgi:hypothetical protein
MGKGDASKVVLCCIPLSCWQSFHTRSTFILYEGIFSGMIQQKPQKRTFFGKT